MNDDHVKDQLCARIEELENEKLELNEKVDALQIERDALAAHVERMRISALGAIHLLPGGDVKAELRDAYDETPATSLARHDIELLEKLLLEARDEQISTHLVVERQLDRLRQQAEGGEA